MWCPSARPRACIRRWRSPVASGPRD
jgi:hypothetical protein